MEPPKPNNPPFPDCPAYGVIGSRGSGENNPAASGWGQGLGPPGLAFARALGQLLPDAEYTANSPPGYPAVGLTTALFHLNAYRASVQAGAKQLDQLIDYQHTACHGKTTLLLVGYSQGAELTGDEFLAMVHENPGDAATIAGVVLFGDPLYNLHDSSDVQTLFQQDGQASLHHNGALTMRGPYDVAKPHSFPASTVGKVLSYCLIDDLVCQGIGGNPFSGQHGRYAPYAAQDAAIWLAYHATHTACPPSNAPTGPVFVRILGTRGISCRAALDVYVSNQGWHTAPLGNGASRLGQFTCMLLADFSPPQGDSDVIIRCSREGQSFDYRYSV